MLIGYQDSDTAPIATVHYDDTDTLTDVVEETARVLENIANALRTAAQLIPHLDQRPEQP